MRSASCAISESEIRNAVALLAMLARLASRNTLARSARRCSSVKRLTLESTVTASLPHPGEVRIRLINSSNWDALRLPDFLATVASISWLLGRYEHRSQARS